MALLASRISVTALAYHDQAEGNSERGKLQIAIPYVTLDIFLPWYKQQLESTSWSVEVVMR